MCFRLLHTLIRNILHSVAFGNLPSLMALKSQAPRPLSLQQGHCADGRTGIACHACLPGGWELNATSCEKLNMWLLNERPMHQPLTCMPSPSKSRRLVYCLLNMVSGHYTTDSGPCLPCRGPWNMYNMLSGLMLCTLAERNGESCLLPLSKLASLI